MLLVNNPIPLTDLHQNQQIRVIKKILQLFDLLDGGLVMLIPIPHKYGPASDRPQFSQWRFYVNTEILTIFLYVHYYAGIMEIAQLKVRSKTKYVKCLSYIFYLCNLQCEWNTVHLFNIALFVCKYLYLCVCVCCLLYTSRCV